MHMAHPIEEGRVTVVKCVTPGAYWLKCPSCRGSSKIPESIRRKSYSGEYYPHEGAHVFVRDPDGFFYRGIVRGRRVVPNSPAWVFVVQLVATFQVKEFHPEDVFPNFGEKRSSCESAHLISLHHLLPRVPPSDGKVANGRVSDEVRNWDKDVKVVEVILWDYDELYYEQLSVIKGCPFGKLTTGRSQKTDLSELLIRHKVARRVTYRFEQLVRCLMSPMKVDEILPTFDPYAELKEESVLENVCVQNDPVHDLTKFRVYEDDKELHRRLAKGFFINILLSEAPAKDDETVRFVAPNGTLVLGIVIRVNVHSFIIAMEERKCHNLLTCHNFFHETEEQDESSVVRNWSRMQGMGFEFDTSRTVRPFLPDEEPDQPESDPKDERLFYDFPNEEPDQPESDPKDERLFYDFSVAVHTFRAQGGIIEDYLDTPLSDTKFSHVLDFVEQALDNLGIITLREWQKVCFPSLLGKENTLIIGPEGEGKLVLALVSLMSWMNSGVVNRNQSKGPSSTVIVVVPHWARADYVADTITQFGGSVIELCVSMSSFVSEKQKTEMSSCDVLITNPKNFLQLMTEECSLLGSHEGRVSQIVFDSFESLHRLHEKHLRKIFEAVNSYKVAPKAQRIYLSHVWGGFLLDYIQRPVARCVTDITEASFSYGLLPSISHCSFDNWAEKLISTLQSNVMSKRLLLCHDENEAVAIEGGLKSLDVCRSIYESMEEEQISKSIDWWKTTPNALLICSDPSFQALDFAHDANCLISWMGIDNRSALNQRYRAISGHPVDQRRQRTRVFLYYNSDNLKELIFFKKLVENVATLATVSEELTQHLSVVFERREKQKQEELCPFVCGFGSCVDSFTCSYRHTFLDKDTVLAADKTQFLSVELVKIHSGFRFSVRIEKVVSNQSSENDQIGSFTSNLPEITAQLQESYSLASLQPEVTWDDIHTGDIVGASFPVDGTQNLRRVKIIRVHQAEENCEVMPMDFDEPHARVPLVHLFKIPSGIASLAQDLVDIYLAQLVPANYNCDWAHETRHFLSNMIELIERKRGKKCEFLAGPVNVQLNGNLIVDFLRLVEYRENAIVELHSLNDALLKNEFTTMNLMHLNSLSALALQCGKPPLISKERVECFGFRYNLPKDFVLAEVSAFEDPGQFYVQMVEERESLTNLEQCLADCMACSRTPLQVIASNELCAVQIDGNWNRAIIQFSSMNSDNEAFIMCVDHGDTRAVPYSQLFCLPDEFISIPYFAIECGFIGIKPIDDVYSDEAIKGLEKLVRNDDDSMKQVYVKFLSVTHASPIPRYYNCHGIIMKETNSPDVAALNVHLVLNGQARMDPITSHFLIQKASQG